MPQIPTIKGHKDSIKGPLGGPGWEVPETETVDQGATGFRNSRYLKEWNGPEGLGL